MQEKKFLKQVGTRIRSIRKRSSLSQEDLAERSGLHPTYIGEIERATVNASIGSLNKIAAALEIPLHELLQLPGKKETSKDLIIRDIVKLIRKQDVSVLKYTEKTLVELVDLLKKQRKKR
jgi:transcriptional regulator with XRE-family HTH domain